MMVVVFAAGGARAADDDRDITIIYDASLREFTHWCPGIVTAGSCDHPFHDYVHFYRGQTIHLVVRGAHLADMLAVELKVTALVEPTVPVFGGLTELPKVKLIEPAESLVQTAVQRAAAPKAIKPDDVLYFFLPRWQETDTKHELQDYLKQTLIDPTSTAEFLQLVSSDDVRLIGLLNARLDKSGPLVGRANEIKQQLDQLKADTAVRYDAFCPVVKSPAAGTKPDPDDDARFTIQQVARLARLVDRERALLAGIQASGVRDIAATVVADAKLLDNPKTAPALEIESCSLDKFWSDFKTAFPVALRMAFVDRLDIDPATKAYIVKPGSPAAPAALTTFVNRLNANLPAAGATADSVARLKKNLTVMFENTTPIELAVARLNRARPVAVALCLYRNPKDSACKMTCESGPAAAHSETVYTFQQMLDDITVATVDRGADANCAVQQMPLPPSMSERTLGRWFGSEEVVMTVKQGTRVPLFDITNIGPGDRLVLADTKDVSPKPAQTATQDLAASRTGTFLIHNLYRFQLGAGFMTSTMDDQRYQVLERTLADGKTKEKFFAVTRDRSYHFLPTIELMINFVPRDGFPWTPRYTDEKRPSRWRDFSALIGFSLADPTKDFLFGAGWLPGRVGVGLKGGFHLGFKDTLPDNVKPGQALTEETTIVQQTLRQGYFIGVTLETQLFKDIFGLIFKP